MTRRPRFFGAAMRAPLVALSLCAALFLALPAVSSVPPWVDPGDVPLPSGVRTVTPKHAELEVFVEPAHSPSRRGTVPQGARVPIYATKRGPGCLGRWLAVGPFGWACADRALFSDESAETTTLLRRAAEVDGDGLPYRYYFVGRGGAFAWDRLDRVEDDAPDQELDAGFAVAAVAEVTAFGESYVRTTKGRYVALRDLAPAHPSAFAGETIANGSLDFGWVVAPKTTLRAGPSATAKALGPRVRFERVDIAEVRGQGQGAWLRVQGRNADAPEAWIAARDVARPSASPRPASVAADERWIDVELASQTLVAWEGERPVFATLVSTGRGPDGSETATPRGENRIWVKLATSTMDNLERRDELASADDAGQLYSLDDVPYVQFFHKAVALHGVFWHRNFGRVQSHGCVNLAPRDARFLFGFTSPRLPFGWSAALPVAADRGTLVRVR